MTRAFNIEGLVRLQNYMGGKTLSDAQFFAVLNADVVEMIDGEESTTKRRYFRIAENDESITFSCILGSSQQQMVVTKATKQLNVSTTSILSGQPGSITSEMLADGAVTSEKLAPGLDVSGLFFILPAGTRFPYTLTEEDKTKLSAATILILPTTRGLTPFQRSSNEGLWCSLRYTNTIWTATVSESSILAPEIYAIYDSTSVKFNVAQTLTAAQKLQARTNIGAAEVGTAALAPLAVTTDKIADGAVTTDKLATSSVATQKLQDLCVTTPKIADQAVDTTKLNTGGSPGGSVE